MTEMRAPRAPVLDAQGDELIGPSRFVACVFGVAHQVDEDLQDFVLVDGDRRHVAEFALQRDAMACESAGIQPQAVFHQIDDLDGLRDAAELGVVLLHGDGVLDVLEVLAQRGELLQCRALIGEQLLAERGEIFGYALSAFVLGDELPGALTLLEQQGGEARDTGRLRLPDALRDETCRDVDAVQNVADVVQDIRGDFGHAGLARGRHQLLVHALQFQFLALALRRVLNDGDRAQGLTVRADQPAGVRQGGARRSATSRGATMSSRLLMVSPRSARASGRFARSTGVTPSAR